jgi:SAM-dependent methyltransferase
MTKKTTCRVCGETNKNDIYIGKEMMYGSREKFEYFQCSNCDCLQISKIPKDMSKYYPKDSYYSLTNDVSVYYKNRLKNLYKYVMDNISLRILHKLPVFLESGGRTISDGIRSLSPLNLRHKAKILDIGCGSGVLLMRLRNAGFTNATGTDPFVKKVTNKNGEIVISNTPLEKTKESYDIIMMHHAFEHVPNPIETLKTIKKHLKPAGKILIRIPFVDSELWKTYKENWFQMDPPRHLYLHSKKSIEFLAKKAGLKLDHTIFDSNELPILFSKGYKNGIGAEKMLSEVSKEDLTKLKKQAFSYNKAGVGDQVCLYFSVK